MSVVRIKMDALFALGDELQCPCENSAKVGPAVAAKWDERLSWKCTCGSRTVIQSGRIVGYCAPLGKRVYGRWGGQPSGRPEDTARCVVSVPAGGRSPLFHQCYNARGKGTGEYEGLLCGRHAGMQKRGLRLSVPDEED